MIFSNCQRILDQRLSIAIDAENLENVTQLAHFPHFALAALLDRDHFLMPLGTPCYHTFVKVLVAATAAFKKKTVKGRPTKVVLLRVSNNCCIQILQLTWVAG